MFDGILRGDSRRQTSIHFQQRYGSSTGKANKNMGYGSSGGNCYSHGHPQLRHEKNASGIFPT
ncbi:MAG TPA: hypothetical protein PLP05_09800 [Sedimentisphaerales bacterium]|nr:hypothetical protein [Sedimentisphaerales bacterium]